MTLTLELAEKGRTGRSGARLHAGRRGVPRGLRCGGALEGLRAYGPGLAGCR